LPSLFTPATLFVVSSFRAVTAQEGVPCPDIANADISFRFAYSPPTSNNITNENYNTSKYFLGPRTVLSRLSSGTATSGQILPIRAPSLNSSYSIQFTGPAVRCRDANVTISNIIKDLLQQFQKKPLAPDIKAESISYFGFVPDFDSLGNTSTMFDGVQVTPLADIRFQKPSNASNEIWIFYERYIPGTHHEYGVAGIPENRNIACQLYNATYDIGIKFDGSSQTITRNHIEFLNTVDYPKDNSLTDITNMVRHSYSAFMWVLSDQVVGSMGQYSDKTSTFSTINTQIQHNSLLGSPEFQLFFDKNHNILPAKENRTSDQRQEDMKLAQNKTISELIEDLSFNISMSMMASYLLS
jgi:hypothetical protein